MEIEVRLFATFTKFLPAHAEGQKVMMAFPEGTTIKDVVMQLGVPLNAIKLVFLNSKAAKFEDLIRDGDRLGIFPPVAGG